VSTVRKTRGEKLEGVAFQFCKVATVALILGKWTLPVASALAAGLYVSAFFSGKSDTKCILRYPLFIAAFWGCVSVVSFWFTFRPDVLAGLLRQAFGMMG
jgi:hypothetical protein